MNQALALSGISYSVPGLDILKALDLDVAEQQYYAIAGVNGAGKSTLIKLILDLIRPAPGGSKSVSSGAITRNATAATNSPTCPKNSMSKRISPGASTSISSPRSITSSQAKQKLSELAERLDFPPDRLDSRVDGYSKGMVQKLGLVSCFMLDRRLIILDEPLSGLDPRARYHFKELMREEKSAGRTVLYSTHLLADAEDLCDQFGILHDGEMKYQGTPADCLQRYQAETLEQAYMKCISE